MICLRKASHHPPVVREYHGEMARLVAVGDDHLEVRPFTGGTWSWETVLVRHGEWQPTPKRRKR